MSGGTTTGFAVTKPSAEKNVNPSAKNEAGLETPGYLKSTLQVLRLGFLRISADFSEANGDYQKAGATRELASTMTEKINAQASQRIIANTIRQAEMLVLGSNKRGLSTTERGDKCLEAANLYQKAHKTVELLEKNARSDHFHGRGSNSEVKALTDLGNKILKSGLEAALMATDFHSRPGSSDTPGKFNAAATAAMHIGWAMGLQEGEVRALWKTYLASKDKTALVRGFFKTI
jgi:hypothetical protein